MLSVPWAETFLRVAGWWGMLAAAGLEGAWVRTHGRRLQLRGLAGERRGPGREESSRWRNSAGSTAGPARRHLDLSVWRVGDCSQKR